MLLLKMIGLICPFSLPPEIQEMILNYVSHGPILSSAILRGETVGTLKDIREPSADPVLGRGKLHYRLDQIPQRPVYILGNRYISKSAGPAPSLKLPPKNLITGIRVAVDEIGVRMFSILTTKDGERKLFAQSPKGPSIWYTYFNVKNGRFTGLTGWCDPIKLRWIEPAAWDAPTAPRILWDDIDHPLETDLHQFFDNSISRQPGLFGPTHCFYFQNMSFQSMSGLSMSFSPSGRLVALRKYANNNHSKTIGTVDDRSTSVYFGIQAGSEYITDVWVRHYEPASPSMKDLAVVVRTSRERTCYFGPNVGSDDAFVLENLTRRKRVEVCGLYAEMEPQQHQIASFGVYSNDEGPDLPYVDLPGPEQLHVPPLSGPPRKAWFLSSASFRGFQSIYVCHRPSASDPSIVRCSGMRIEYQDRSETLGQYFPELEEPIFVNSCHDGLLFKHGSNNAITCVTASTRRRHSRSGDVTFVSFNEGLIWWFSGDYGDVVLPDGGGGSVVDTPFF